MNRLCIATRGIGSWRERLANPHRQWKRKFSALETAVSWELAAHSPAGLPEPILELFRGSGLADPLLLIATAEHGVPLPPGDRAESQCDVWALLHTKSGALSLSVEAKANEPFGQNNESLPKWLMGDGSEQSRKNRQRRWDYIKEHLPASRTGYSDVAYQLLHRCAAAGIEAKRLRLENAASVVQAFESPPESFEEFARLCKAMEMRAERGQMQMTAVGDVRLGIGWADCPFATDAQIAAVV